ncbi:integrase core domain-containing protein [Sphaerisporangium aureirubrum]|uniref:Integrase core domain-containing protein n=1 Tax=Sphaerisporangium aureirubrum TaxID=1544736 RepID=A0ABW1NH70_9ACTN
MHGELTTLGIKIAPSTIWEILKQEGVDPSPARASTTWADFLCSQADALPACDFIETVILNGQRQYILAVSEHATRRVRVLGTTAQPTATRVIQAIRNLVMDLEDAGCRARYLIRDRDGKFPALMEEILADSGIHTVLTGICIPRMDSVMERWVQSCRRELLDCCLLWNERHLRHALREYEEFYNQHRPHQALDQVAPLRASPDPTTDPATVADLNVHRRLLTTSAASIHQLGAAAALVGGREGLRASEAGHAGGRGLWSRYDVAANTMLAGGWLIEQHTLRTQRHLDQATDDAVRLKDLAVIGSALTNIATVAAGQLVKHEFPQGLPLDAEGNLASGASRRGKRYYRWFTVMKRLNRAFAAGAIGLTPSVNFKVLRSYRPGAIFRLFT